MSFAENQLLEIVDPINGKIHRERIAYIHLMRRSIESDDHGLHPSRDWSRGIPRGGV